MCRFSVIVPLYNKASYVWRAIESVLGQTFRDFELIVVDDGSTDNSAEVAKACLDGHSNATLLHQENAGVSVARNNGAAASNTGFLCFLDADDWWEPTFLEEINRLIDDFPDAGIYGTNYTIINETKHKTRVAPVGIPDGFERGYINYCKAYSKHMGMPLHSSSVCILKRVFIEMGGFPSGITLGEDFILWIHIALKYKVAFVNKTLSNYNQDIPVNLRAVGQLHSPAGHMLWNLQDLEDQETSNADLKALLDKLRVYGLMPYFLSKQYHKEAVQELLKVNWNAQPRSILKEYRLPLPYLRLRYRLFKLGSFIKTSLKHIK